MAKKSTRNARQKGTHRVQTRCLSALAAVGGTLACGSAAALELGELNVQSNLGQPLRASIAYALAPGETLASNCVTMQSATSAGGLPALGAARLSVGNGIITLIGETPVREPMVAANIVIRCPATPHLSREYLAFVDPPSHQLQPSFDRPETALARTTVAEPRRETVVLRPEDSPAPKAAPVVADIAPATRYQVQRGETLSEIAARIENRSMSLWTAVDAIFDANPAAFTNNSPDSLKAGSWLAIPSLDGQTAAVVANEIESQDAAVPDLLREPWIADFSESKTADMTTATIEPASPAPEAIADPIVETTAEPVAEPVAEQIDTSPAEPVAIVLDDLPVASLQAPADKATTVIIDADLPGPTTTATTPNGAIATIASTGPISNPSNAPAWLVWLAAAAAALAFGLTLFRRRGYGDDYDFHPTPALAGDQPLRRFNDVRTVFDRAPSDSEQPATVEVNLDARVAVSDGLQDSIQAVEDAKLSAATKLDFELAETSVVAQLDVAAVEEDEYDMSVILDATKVPLHDDVTLHDFKALEVPAADETSITQTLMQDVELDYQVLEQDYEDELTATQALNKEIAQAAAELTAKLKIQQGSVPSDDTTAVHLASVTELDVTAQLPAQTDKDRRSNDDTMSMPAKKGS